MQRSPTDTIVAAMEEAETATACLIILTQSDGQIVTLGSSDRRVVRLGLLETAKQWLIADMLRDSMRDEK
jgi:hypothetical protein